MRLAIVGKGPAAAGSLFSCWPTLLMQPSSRARRHSFEMSRRWPAPSSGASSFLWRTRPDVRAAQAERQQQQQQQKAPTALMKPRVCPLLAYSHAAANWEGRHCALARRTSGRCWPRFDKHRAVRCLRFVRVTGMCVMAT